MYNRLTLKTEKKWYNCIILKNYIKIWQAAYLPILILTVASFRWFQKTISNFFKEIRYKPLLPCPMSVLWHFLSLKKQFSSLSNRVVHRRSSAPPPIDNAILTIPWPLQILRQHRLALALALHLIENLIDCLMNIFCYVGILWYTGPSASNCHHGDQFIIVRDCLLQLCRIRTFSYWYLCWLYFACKGVIIFRV